MKRRYLLKLGLAGAAGLTALLVWANWPLSDPLAPGVVADRILVLKSQRQLQLYAKGKLLKTYTISLGRHPVGPKEREGDKRTPEGLYAVAFHKPDSSCHIALRTSYPSPAERAAAAKRGVQPGGDIMIHGLRNGLGLLGRCHRWMDWTAGCMALTNPEAEEVYRVVTDGTPIEIRP